mgnify:CR=1 FL=1
MRLPASLREALLAGAPKLEPLAKNSPYNPPQKLLFSRKEVRESLFFLTRDLLFAIVECPKNSFLDRVPTHGMFFEEV